MHRFSTTLALVCVLPVAVASSGCQRDSAAARDAERERVLQERMTQDETAVFLSSLTHGLTKRPATTHLLSVGGGSVIMVLSIKIPL
jgi:hypothetical protein